MVKISKSLIALFAVCAFVAGFSSCSKTESTHEKAVKVAKEAMEKAGEKVEEAGQKMKEAAKPAKK